MPTATFLPELLERSCAILTFNQIFSTFMMVWWFCGAVVGTVEGPWEGEVTMGYFASWTACVASLMLFNDGALSAGAARGW